MSYENKEWLYYQYIVLEKTINQIAKFCGRGYWIIRDRLIKFEIPIRRTGILHYTDNLRWELGKGNRKNSFYHIQKKLKNKMVDIIKRMKRRLIGRKLSEEHKQKISIGLLEHYKEYDYPLQPPMLEEIKQKISKTLKGRKRSKECIEKGSKKRRGSNHWNWQGGLITIKCAVCGKEKEIKKSKKRERNFCSKVCQGYYNIKYNLKSTDTYIELVIMHWLIENQIVFKKQYVIEYDDTYTVPDFFIEPNICLYCDGNIWHNKFAAKKKDKKQNKGLKRLNYKVIRLKGPEIKDGVRPVELIR